MSGSLPGLSTIATRVATIGVDKDLGILWAKRVLSPITGGKLQPTHELHAVYYRLSRGTRTCDMAHRSPGAPLLYLKMNKQIWLIKPVN